jgi:DNA-binding transcriptional MerR regulator
MLNLMKMTTNKVQIPDRLYFRIGDVADLLGIKPYVLRYWESEFPMISPQKSTSGQRVYRKSDVETVLMIKHLLYEERYSVEGAKKRIKELRKEGDLKLFKEETVSSAVAESPVVELTPDHRKELRTLSHELKALSQVNLVDLFSY